MKLKKHPFITGLSVAVLLSLCAENALAFGAIAVNDERGLAARDVGYGVGWGSTRRDAERDAIRQCRNAGNDECKVAVWFETCGAYAGNRVRFGIGYGSRLGDAEQDALDACGDSNCRIIVSDCE
ncbi:DUF4189 domain-containing protein [Rhizobium oryzicola]|uniref:DUF4189 domain-containing protein n=1 Tax=Rhizobium oryzicola TaxID=1232668 RepID=A0ABT8SUF3_9HYPH|nr:DUF4189 domain-containing protein [Rhizobium oryzicola]MDO1582074.1 DUF4189 domain-containing protein [Rhizobium oryzicola]